MPTCRHCYSVYPREQFIHGIGPRTQVCVRCGLKKGLVTEEEVPSYYSKSIANSRFSAIARRWAPLVWLGILWTFWILYMIDVSPWNWYTLAILILGTLGAPLYIFIFSTNYRATMSRLTPEYDRPEGH